MNEYTPELFELIDGHGNRRNFEVVDSAVLNGEQYYAMIPSIEDENFLDVDLDVIILKVIEENGEEILASIDDDEEFYEVSQYFSENADDLYDEYDYD